MQKGAGDFMPYYTQDYDKYLFEKINTAENKPFIGTCQQETSQGGLLPNNRLVQFMKHDIVIEVMFPLGLKEHDIRLENWDNAEKLLLDFVNYIYGIDSIIEKEKRIDVRIDGTPVFQTNAWELTKGKASEKGKGSENNILREDFTGCMLSLSIKFTGNLPCHTEILFTPEQVKSVISKTSKQDASKTNALGRFR